MKKSKWLHVSLIIILIIAVTSIAAFSIGKRVFTNEQNQILSLLDSKANKVKKEIKESYSINASNYTELDIKDIPKFTNGTINGFENTEFTQEASTIIGKAVAETPIGSLKPIILVKNDKTEVLVGYKDKDGNNVLEKSWKSGKEWKSSKESKKGSSMSSFN